MEAPAWNSETAKQYDGLVAWSACEAVTRGGLFGVELFSGSRMPAYLAVIVEAPNGDIVDGQRRFRRLTFDLHVGSATTAAIDVLDADRVLAICLSAAILKAETALRQEYPAVAEQAGRWLVIDWPEFKQGYLMVGRWWSMPQGVE